MAPYLTLMSEGRPAAPPRPARGLQRPALDRARRRALALLPGDFPPWPAVYQQTRRWLGRRLLRGDGARSARAAALERGARPTSPTAVIFDSATRQSTPESGHGRATTGTRRARAPRSTRPSIRWASCWRCYVTPANARTGRRWRRWRRRCRRAPGRRWRLGFVDQGYTGEEPRRGRRGARDPRWRSSSWRRPSAGFVLLPRRWVVERSFAWAARFRRLAKDYERLPETVAGLHFLAFACLMLHRLVTVAAQSP